MGSSLGVSLLLDFLILNCIFFFLFVFLCESNFLWLYRRHCTALCLTRQPRQDDSQRGSVSRGPREKGSNLHLLLVCRIWQHQRGNQIYFLARASGGLCKPNCGRISAKQGGIFGLFKSRWWWAIFWAVCSPCNTLPGGTASGKRTAGCSHSSQHDGLWSILPARTSQRQLKQLMKREFGLVEFTAFSQCCCFCQTEICLTVPD